MALNKGARNNVITGPSKSNMQVDLPHIGKEVHMCIYRHIHACTGSHTHSPFSTENKINSEIIATYSCYIHSTSIFI